MGGLLVIRGGDENAAFTIVSSKSERRVNPHFGNVAQQDNAIVLDTVANEVTVIGATHIPSIPNGFLYEPPGALVEIKGEALPKLRWLGSTIRVRDNDVSAGSFPARCWIAPVASPCLARRVLAPTGRTKVVTGRTKDRLDEYAIPRRNLTSTAIAGSSGNGFLTYFTAERPRRLGASSRKHRPRLREA
ncbi:hypothetical protein JHV56_05190 [Arthrobacter sp. BHU FT2]|nr:hypothetical protein [Arthrobacter sp. BHU FT2]